MQRREAIQKTVLILGGALAGTEVLITACQPNAPTNVTSIIHALDPKLLEEIADVIIPNTPDSPGAKKAKVGDFMKLILQDCYAEEEQKIMAQGLEELEKTCHKEFQSGFIELKPEEKQQTLLKIDREAKDYEKNRRENTPAHYFTLVKRLTTFAYFSSEIGTTKALRYNPIPKRFEGCVPYKAGEKAWA